MTVQEMVQLTGELPTKFSIGDENFEFFSRKRNNGSFLATIWKVEFGKQIEMLCYGEGSTLKKAKEDLKNKILKL